MALRSLLFLGRWHRRSLPNGQVKSPACHPSVLPTAAAFDASGLLQHALSSLWDRVSGFADSLPAIRALLPLRSKYTIGCMPEDLALTLDVEVHNAEDDVTALCQIMKNASLTADFIREHSATVRSYEERQTFRLTAKIETYFLLICCQCQSSFSSMTQKAVTSGLVFYQVYLFCSEFQAQILPAFLIVLY